MRRIIVVGASLAGHQAAKCLRGLGYHGQLTIIGAEVHRPYDRYPLSKGYLAGELERGGLDIEPGDLDVDWRLGRTATGLDLAGRYVTIDAADRAPFDGLVVATGSRPRVPFALGGGVGGVFVLRTVEDGTALRAALAGPPCRVVIVGGGLIGAEVASLATTLGHSTTLVDGSAVPTARTLGVLVARHLLSLHVEKGVRLVSFARVSTLDVQTGRVRGLFLDTGQRVEADLVVLATGTRPNIEWLKTSGLTISNGLGCRATLHAKGSDVVVGAGDVVHAPHPALDGESVRLEHWASTRNQAMVAARNLLAGPSLGHPQSELPTFGTTIHGAAVRVLGFPAHAENSQVAWGSLQDGQAIVAMHRRGRLVAAIAVNATDMLTLLRESWAGEWGRGDRGHPTASVRRHRQNGVPASRLENKPTLVTAANSGIGQAVTSRFRRESAARRRQLSHPRTDPRGGFRRWAQRRVVRTVVTVAGGGLRRGCASRGFCGVGC
jgi:NADPH-dependent 2,4-dienoyl-CoA reductase/sulfur reductase-like enzyme